MQCRVGRKVAAAGLLAMAAAGGCNQTPAKARTAITLYKQGAYAQAAAELQPTTTKKDEN